MEFRDWLDAGFVYLTKDCSPAVRRIITQACAAEEPEEVTDAFERLEIQITAEVKVAEDNEREQRRRTGIVELAPAGAAQAAVDDWNAAILADRERLAAEGLEGDDGDEADDVESDP